jgi:hypothetical protein
VEHRDAQGREHGLADISLVRIDPPPGNTVIWRGLSRLTDIVLGIMIGVQLVGN